jgi:arsenate reductase
MFPILENKLEEIFALPVSEERKLILQVLIEYIKNKRKKEEPIRLNFICTHNSRRSQLSQIWAQTAADIYGIPAQCYSGGVEVTAFNERAVASIERFGFKVIKRGHSNPIYFVFHTQDGQAIIGFSKVFDDEFNTKKGFAAIMTCSHADENCPFIPGAEARIPVRFEDPKAFDDTEKESEKYDERSMQIASEMFYVFANAIEK